MVVVQLVTNPAFDWNFAFKAMQPIFDIAPFEVCGRPDDAQHVSLWARTPEGQLAMQAFGVPVVEVGLFNQRKLALIAAQPGDQLVA